MAITIAASCSPRSSRVEETESSRIGRAIGAPTSSTSCPPASRRSAKPPALRREHEDIRRIAPGPGIAVEAGGFLAGRPEDIIEALKAVEKRYPGLDRVICATPLGTPLDVQLADLDRFAKEVIPAFRDTRTAAAAQ
jgi:hypothetical protein